LPQHRHIAPRKIFHKNSIFFCGAWGCLSYQEHFAKTEKKSANLEKPSHSRSVNSSFHSRLMCFSILSAFFFSFFSFGKIISEAFDLQRCNPVIIAELFSWIVGIMWGY